MVHLQYSQIRRFISFITLCLLFASIPNSIQAQVQPTNQENLIRVDLPSQADLNKLAQLRLSIYIQLYTAQGGVILLLPVDPQTQESIYQMGYSIQALDTQPDQKPYYLLYGLEDALKSVRLPVDLLVLEGRQAVAQATTSQVEKLSEMGIKAQPLVLRRLATPRSETSAPVSTGSTMPMGVVQEMVAKVKSNKLENYNGSLSGEWEVDIGGTPYTIMTRYTLTDQPIKKATRFAYEHFQSIGLPTSYHTYNMPLDGKEKRNVIAEQKGITHPEKIVLLTAHLDSTGGGTPWTLAPGSDDNASGSAAVMHIAKILKDYVFGCSIRYTLFTGEEQGLYGSAAYAELMNDLNKNIQGVLNMDMVAYNTIGSAPTIEIHTRSSNTGDLAIANLFADVIPAYDIDLIPYIRQDSLSFSDHAPFWWHGYSAILTIEDWGDHTPYYHTTDDQLETLNKPYYKEFTKAALGTIAHMGCLEQGLLSGKAKDADSLVPIPGATVAVRQAGTLVASTQTQADGSYELNLNPGEYKVVFSDPGYLTETIKNVRVKKGRITNLNAFLTPCGTVEDPLFIYRPSYPLVDETVVFTATVASGENPISYAWLFGDGSEASGKVVNHAFSQRGDYLVELTANNSCSVPATIRLPVFVETSLFFLPLVSNKNP